MSAYIVSKAHVDALVRLAQTGPKTERAVHPDHAWSFYFYHDGETGPTDPEAIGRMLVDENVRSVSHRYDGESIDTLPGPYDKSSLLDYHYAPGRALTAVQGLKALNGYDYQTCECPDWPSTLAYDFCDALRSRLIGCLPGYDEADWSID